MSTRLGAGPRTPTIGRSKIRRFGTVLSVNSPGVTPSVQKKAKSLRSNLSVSKPSIPEEEASSPFQQPTEKQQFTVTFDAGPIGLQIDPATCRVQCILGDDSPARTLGMILKGDVVVAVNGMPMAQDAHRSEELWSILQNVKTRRSITFERHVVVGELIVPMDGLENRSLSTNVLSPLPPPRSITFLNDIELSKGPIAQPAVAESVDNTTVAEPAPDELALMRRELLGANNLLQQMQAKLDALEAENACLKNAPPKQQSYSAIRDMEFKMRIQSLENQLLQSNASRSKLKEQLLVMDQRMQEQSEHHKVTMEQTNQELQNSLAHSKQTTQLLETTCRDLTATKKEWQDEVNGLQRERDQLLERVEQHVSELERSRAAKVQSDVRLQQLDENRIVLEEELQRTRAKVEESDLHAQRTSEQLLQTIRSKDVQIESLRIELLATQTANATLQTDLSEKDAVVRQVMADAEQKSKDQQSLHQDFVNLSSLLEMSHQEKERLEGHIVKLDNKLVDRNQTINSLKVTLQQVEDDFANRMTEHSEAMAASTDSIDGLYHDKEVLTRQVLEAQAAAKMATHAAQELRESLEAAQSELSSLRNAASSEKCDLLKQLEKLEGTVKEAEATILRQEASMLDSDAQLRATLEHLDRLSVELNEHQQRLREKEEQIKKKEGESMELKELLLSMECENTASIQKLNEQLTQSKQVNVALKNEKHTLTRRLEATYKSLASASIVELTLKTTLKENQAECTSLKTENVQLQLNVEKLRGEISSRDATIESLSVDLVRSQSDAKHLQLEVHRLNLDLAGSESTYEELSIEMVGREAHYQILLSSLYAEREQLLTAQMVLVNDLNKTVKELTSEATGLRKEGVKLNTALRLNDTEIVELQTKIDNSTAKYEKLLVSTNEEKEILTLQLEKCTKDIFSLETKLSLSEKLLTDKSSELVASAALAERLKSELLASDCSLQEASKKVDESNLLLESINLVTQAKLDSFHLEVSRKDDLISNLLSQIEEKELSFAQSLEHSRVIDEELSYARAELIRNQEHLDSVKAALEEAQCQLNDSSSALRDTEVMVESLNESIRRYHLQLAEKAEEFQNLTKSYEILKIDKDSLQVQLVKTQSDYNFASDELQSSVDAANASNARAEELMSNMLVLERKFESELTISLGLISQITEERDTQRKELLELRDRICNLSISDNDLRSEVERLKFQLANSEADFQKCNELLESQSREFDLLKRNYIDQKLRCDKLLYELKQSESNLDSFSKLVDNQNSQIFSLKQSLSGRQAEHDRELRKTQLESQDLLIANRSLHNTNMTLSEKITILETLTKNDCEVISNLQGRIGELESEHALTVTRANRNEQDLLQRIDGLSQDILNRHVILEEREKVIVDLQQRNSTLSSDYQRLSEELTSAIANNLELKRAALHFEIKLEVAKRNEDYMMKKSEKDWTLKVDSLERQYDALLSEASVNATCTKAEFDELRTENDRHIGEIKSLRELLNGLNSEKALLEDSVLSVKSALLQREADLSEAILRVETARKSILEKSDRLEDVERSLELERTKARELEIRYKNLAHDSSEARNAMVADVICLKAEIDSLKLELSESSSVTHSLKMNISDSELLVKRLHEELNTGKDALAELTAKSAAKAWVLECEVEASKTEVNCYRDSVLKLTYECNALRTALKALESNFNKLTELHAAAETKLDSMESIMVQEQENLLAQVDFANNTASKVSEELLALRLEHDNVVSAASFTKRQLEETIRFHESEAFLRSERQLEWNRKLDEARSSHHRCQSDLDIASDKITQLERSVISRNEEIQRLSVLLEKTIEENIASIESTSQSHTSEISVFQQEIEEYSSKLKRARATIDSLSSRIQASEEDLSGVQSERNDLISEKNSLLLLLEEKNRVIADLQIENGERTSEPEILESPFKSLSRLEIKDRCLDLQSQLQSAQKSLYLTNDDLYRRSDHVKQLSHDLDAMSSEIGSLVTANEMLETRLKKVTSVNSLLESASVVANNKISFLEDALQSKSKKLVHLSSVNGKLVDEIQSLQIQSKSDKLTNESVRSNAVHDLALTRQELEYAIARRDEVELLVSENRAELMLLRDFEIESKDKLQQLERENAELKKRLTASTEETSSLSADLTKNVEHYTQRLSSLETECENLRAIVTALKLDIEEKDLDLREKEEKLRLVSEDLLNQRQLTISADQFREDVVSKLSEATRIITSQRFIVKKLESRALDAERNCSHLSERLEYISSTSNMNQANTVESDARYVQRNLEFEQKLKAMDEARMIADQSLKISQDELQKALLECSESEKWKATMRKQMDDLKNSVETMKTQLSASKIARDESIMASHQLQAELDCKRMEIDHLKAALQVSTASAARIKATALLHESDSQTLKGLPESLQQALNLYHTQENTLMRFVDVLLTDSDNVFGAVAAHSEYVFRFLERNSIGDDLKALDLAGMETSSNFLESLRSYMNRLSFLIASHFENRRSQVQVWKDCYSTQKGMILKVLSSSGNETVDKIDLFQDDLMSREYTFQAEHRDIEFFKSVIVSLEENIDALLADLKAANEMLQEKDFLLAKLESLVAHYESSDSKDSSNEFSKDGKSSQHSDTVPASQHKDPNAYKLAAGRLLLQALDGRAHAAKAVAFRQWACQTSAMSALAKHGSSAAALAQQLEETREKLVLLKRHLKKSRRGGTREYSTNLNRIEEHESEI